MRWYESLLIAGIRQGGSPEHVAFIMDGNRRFARLHCDARAIEGHMRGYDKLEMALEWCLELGVRVVSVYAFSIENFRRSASEVDALMRLAHAKFGKMMQSGCVPGSHLVVSSLDRPRFEPQRC
jgi:ditrans,polycis-polyprenyl diphosphate synthase